MTIQDTARPTTTPEPLRPVHGEMFTDHMVSITYSPEAGWSRPQLRLREDLAMNPAMIGLHYGQVVFEGLKAYRQADDGLAIFRPRMHAARFQRSSARLAMPELPEELFLRAAEQVVAADANWLSDDPELSMYLRPLLYGTDASLALRPSREYQFLMMAFITGAFFGAGVKPVKVWINHDYPRAAPGGTGDVKCAANYGPAFRAQLAAEDAGCDQVVWLDAVEKRWIEEMGGMNLFFVRGTGRDATVVSPQLTGTLLPGVTRNTLLSLAERLGYTPREERIALDQLRAEAAAGVITEMFACGTAAVVTPVGEVHDRLGGDFSVNGGAAGPVTLALRTALTDLHHGAAADPEGWLHRVK